MLHVFLHPVAPGQFRLCVRGPESEVPDTFDDPRVQTACKLLGALDPAYHLFLVTDESPRP